MYPMPISIPRLVMAGIIILASLYSSGYVWYLIFNENATAPTEILLLIASVLIWYLAVSYSPPQKLQEKFGKLWDKFLDFPYLILACLAS